MPYFKIETNAPLTQPETESALKALSLQIATQLGKPEDYVMTRIEYSSVMSFAGTTKACAFCTLVSLGLDDEKIPELSQTLTEIVTQILSVTAERIYIQFESPPRNHFAHNGKPFA